MKDTQGDVSMGGYSTGYQKGGWYQRVGGTIGRVSMRDNYRASKDMPQIGITDRGFEGDT